MTRYPLNTLRDYAAALGLAAAGALLAAPAFAGSATGPCFQVDFTIQLDAASLVNLNDAGITAPAFLGRATYNPAALTGTGFEFLPAPDELKSFDLQITQRKAPGTGLDLPDLRFTLDDDTTPFGEPELVFQNASPVGFNYEAVPGTSFGPLDIALGQGQIRLGSGIVPNEGFGSLVFSDPVQLPTAIPTPTAAVAGLLLLTLATGRRRRSAHPDRPDPRE